MHPLSCSNQTHVDTPSDTRKRTNQVPTLNALDKGKVHQTDHGPQLEARDEDGHELELALVDDGPPVNVTIVDGAPRKQECARVLRGREVLRAHHGRLDAVHEHAESERVERGADGLVEDELDERVADIELGLHELVLARLAVERFVVVGRGRGDGLLGGRDVVGREALFEETLPGMCQ